jgi:hypothetical protein
MRKRAVHITKFQQNLAHFMACSICGGNDYEEAIQFPIFQELNAKGFIVGRVIWLGGIDRGGGASDLW